MVIDRLKLHELLHRTCEAPGNDRPAERGKRLFHRRRSRPARDAGDGFRKPLPDAGRVDACHLRRSRNLSSGRRDQPPLEEEFPRPRHGSLRFRSPRPPSRAGICGRGRSRRYPASRLRFRVVCRTGPAEGRAPPVPGQGTRHLPRMGSRIVAFGG